MQPAVFLDRDGTMIHDVGYLSRLEDLRWFPWTIDAIRLLNRAGFVVCVTTNQGGIGLGLLHEDVRARAARENGGDARRRRWRAYRRLVLLSASSAGRRSSALRVDCDCRKPRPGHDSIRRGARSTSISRGRSSSATSSADVGLAEQRRRARRSWCGPGYGDEVDSRRHGGDGAGRGLRGDR